MCVNSVSIFLGPNPPSALVPGKATQEDGLQVSVLPSPEVWALLGKLGP